MALPKIGITAYYNTLTRRHQVYENYHRAVAIGGGEPVLLNPEEEPEVLWKTIGDCQGFVFIGGPDFDASRYGMENHPAMTLLNPATEDFYFQLAEEVIKGGSKPFLGVCLGCQLINVVLGGTLHRHIPEDVPNCIPAHLKQNVGPTPCHDVYFTEGSPLRRIFGMDRLNTNTHHHQAIAKLGEGVEVTARTYDGIVEAITLASQPERFAMGIQWHPERYPYNRLHFRIFEELAKAAR